MYTLLLSFLVALGAVIAALMIVRVAGRRAARRFGKLIPAMETALAKAAPGKSWVRAERAIGDVTNSDEAKGTGALALYADELVFRRVDGEPWRLKLADITDMTEIRAASALDMAEDMIDAAPDYMLKLSWKGGAATFVVEDVTAWTAAIAQARP